MARVQVTEAESPRATATDGEETFSQEVLPYLTRLQKIHDQGTSKLTKIVEEAQHKLVLGALAEAFDLGYRTALEEAVRNPKLLDRYRTQPQPGTTES